MFLILIACSKSIKNEAVPDPGNSILSLPAQNQACTTGIDISTTQNNITFKWNPSAHTETYDLIIKNLETGTSSTHSTNNNELQVTLLRNTPYSWYIVSKSSKTSQVGKSEPWKFYNAGTAATSYAPFPAEILSPGMGDNVTAVSGKINLDWNGSDVDNDVVSYAVHLGTTNTPPVLAENISQSILNDVSVNSNTTYYWKVITKDSKGNSSDSGVYQFRIN